MKIQDRYNGKDVLFEGKRTILFKSIPVGAKIVSARIIVTPVNASGQQLPAIETISFGEGSNIGSITNQSGQFATKTQGTGWVEVDFHGRRTLVSVSGTLLIETSLQVDIGGGSFIEINENGAFKGPDENQYLLSSGNNEGLPGLIVNRVKLTSQSTPPVNPNVSSITIRNTPSNVSLALGEFPAFWMHPGEMPGAETTSDFTTLLQSVLLEADSENGFYRIPLIVQSDTLARLNIDFDIEFQQQVNVLPNDLPEVKLPYDYNGSPQAESGLLSVSLPTNARVLPRETKAHVIGSFNEERIAQGPIGEVETDISVEISPQNAQAHLIAIDEDVTGSAFDFLLQPIDELVRLQLDLRVDLNGKPDSASLLSEPVNFSLDRKTVPGANWHSVKLPQGFRFEELVQTQTRTKRLWLIIQSLAGGTQWISKAVSDSDAGMMHSEDGGLSWRQTLVDGASMSAQYRLRNTPAQFNVPIHLQVGEGEKSRAVSLDRYQALGRVDFNLDFDEVAATINQYLDDPVTKLCPEIEHLANGDFSQTYESAQEKRLPVDWELTMGNIRIVETVGVVILGNLDFEQVTGLSQIVPISAGCDYQLEVFAEALFEDAVVEIIWLGNECSVAQVDRISISITLSDNKTSLVPTRARFKAPDDATQAEVRIKVPEGNSAFVEYISFQATQEVMSNTDLKEIDIQQRLTAWEVIGGTAEELLSDDQGLVNISTEEVSLIQSVSVLENKPFIFSVKGRTTSTANPSVGLYWGNNDSISPPPIVETITPDNLEQHLLEGLVPSAISQLEIRIILPPESNLIIDNVSLRQPEIAEVPLTLISQAPGELTVSDVQVAYETIEPKPLEIPEAGLCSATPADSEPGDVCKSEYVCPVCHNEIQTTDVEVVRTPANRPATVTRCESCHAEISRLGGRLDATARVFPERRSITTGTRTLPGVAANVLASVEPSDPLGHAVDAEFADKETAPGKDKDIALTDINGIGTVRKSLLQQQGIGSIALLAQANPDDLSKILKITSHQAKDIIHQAVIKHIDNE